MYTALIVVIIINEGILGLLDEGRTYYTSGVSDDAQHAMVKKWYV
jgi:hypothetical protein